MTPEQQPFRVIEHDWRGKPPRDDSPKNPAARRRRRLLALYCWLIAAALWAADLTLMCMEKR